MSRFTRTSLIFLITLAYLLTTFRKRITLKRFPLSVIIYNDRCTTINESWLKYLHQLDKLEILSNKIRKLNETSIRGIKSLALSPRSIYITHILFQLAYDPLHERRNGNPSMPPSRIRIIVYFSPGKESWTS